MTVFAPVLQDFQSDVVRLKSLLRLTQKFRDFGGSQEPDRPLTDSAHWVEAAELHAASREVRPHIPILAGSLLLFLVGSFEYFARQLVSAACDEIARSVPKYSELPTSLKKHLREQTLQVALRPKTYSYDENQANSLLLKLLQNDPDRAGPLSVASEVIAITEANLQSTVLHDLMRRIGLDNFWNDVGKQSPLKLMLGTQSEHDAAAEAKRRLDSLMKQRNSLAHPNGESSFPNPDAVAHTADFLLVLAGIAVDIVAIHVLKFQLPHSATAPEPIQATG